MSRVVLFFFHGGSFTKECWKPIIRRLETAPLVQRAGCEFRAVDWRYHGEKSDHSEEGVLKFLGPDKTLPRMFHPLREWTVWGPEDIKGELQKIRGESTTKTSIIGIGHSMGASTLLSVEMNQPGSFDGIVAFEPVHDDGTTSEEQWNVIIDMLVTVTSKRPSEWNSLDEALTYFKTEKVFKRWHAEALEAFFEQGVRKMPDGKCQLATLPSQEASVYSHDKMKFDFAKIQSPVFFEYAPRSAFFNAKNTQKIVDRWPGKCFMGEPIPNTTHVMVLEDPDTCAERILANLARMPQFQP